MTDIPDGDSLEEQLKWRRFADRIDQLFKPDRRKRAELAKALAAYATAAREARRCAYELWASETEGSRAARGRRPTSRDSPSNAIRNPTRIRIWQCSGQASRSSRIASGRCWNRRTPPIRCRR